MKTTTLFISICIFLLALPSLYAQEDLKTIVLDFENREFIKNEEVLKGDFFKIKIDNLNTYLYKVEVINEDSMVTTSLPSNLFTILDLTNLTTLTSGLSSIIKQPNLSAAVDDSLENDLSKIIKSDNINFIYAATASSIKAKIESARLTKTDSKKEIVQKILNAVSIDLLDYKNQLLSNNNNFSSVEYDILDYLILIQKEDKSVIGLDINSIKSKIKTINNDIFSIHNEMNALYTKFLGEINIYIDLVSNNDELKKGKATIDAFYKELDKKFSELETITSVEKVVSVLKELIVVYNNKSFIYESLPIERTGDLSEVTIKITPRDSTTRLHAYSTKFTFATDVEPWSVSSGFYITGNPDEDFSAKAVTDSNGVTTYDLIEEENGDYEVGLNVMIRYNWRLAGKKETFWHVGIGTGVNVGPKIRPRVFLGTGLAFGKKNKFIIDVGGVYMFYDKISSAVDLTGNTSIPENYTVSASKIQAYFSLGYTISLN